MDGENAIVAKKTAAYRTAAFGGAPHQSAALTASPRGEKPCPVSNIVRSIVRLQVTTKGFSLEGEAVKNRLFGTDF
jgi:hypothetical protein